MIKYHKDLIQAIPPLDESTVIWRYMDFQKFQYLIQQSNLYSARIDRFTQQEELSVTEKDAYNYRLSYEELLSVCERDNKRYFVNCWSIADKDESFMWDKFVQGDGIAIKTTIGSLIRSDMSDKNIYISPVQYLDYSQDSVLSLPELNAFWIVVSKPDRFKEEHELRLFYHEDSLNVDHIDIPVCLKTLVQEVRISPYRNDGFSNMVQSILDKAGLGAIQVLESELYV